MPAENELTAVLNKRKFEFIFGSSESIRHAGGCVATIGSFDGVHLGHQAILRKLIAEGQQKSLPVAAVIFEPQPQEYFARNHAAARLMRLREKVAALANAGVDYVVCLKFNQSLCSLTAEQFIQKVLVEQLDVKHLEIGDDFRFGCDRRGDFALLRRTGQTLGFTVADAHTLIVSGERVSSTRIRQLLEQGDLDEAAHLLGRPYSVSGRVFYGRQLGRRIGVPTANLGLGRFRAPVNGVYVVTAQLRGDDRMFGGVANVGRKPTVAGGSKPLLETHLFEFDQAIYGETLTVNFLQKIRDEQKFDSLDALIAQISKDVEFGQRYFNQYPDTLLK